MSNPNAYIKCPKCEQSSTVDFWDTHTKNECGIAHDEPFVSSGDTKKKHDDQKTYFYCPVCEREVNGVDLERVD